MNIEELREYCLSKIAVSEGFPFDEETLVFKVLDKMFLLTNITGELRMNVKCEPEKAIELREAYSSVLPGYHMNKKYWNTVVLDGSVSNQQIEEWIDDSYDQVVNKMTKTKQNELRNWKQIK
ncbi:MmcQ-like protein [Labilibaculum filiforme]|uniref:MmcQ-like protein n=1 Tax=Labilibaculum filiforme TaxID=1940526 RepID=A0A2N3HXM5_9BACT|nr:MmcQ/YjbR family DNA-binding protein [Labilibaculum filiforme]PKQ62815.1 MmcQ-like protein [Labilibaculum filiforme]